MSDACWRQTEQYISRLSSTEEDDVLFIWSLTRSGSAVRTTCRLLGTSIVSRDDFILTTKLFFVCWIKLQVSSSSDWKRSRRRREENQEERAAERREEQHYSSSEVSLHHRGQWRWRSCHLLVSCCSASVPSAGALRPPSSWKHPGNTWKHPGNTLESVGSFRFQCESFDWFTLSSF